MEDTAYRAIAIVGAGAILPDAPNVPTFWRNLTSGKYSINDVPPERWNPALYYDPDRNAPDKTYSRIGGWVREFAWDPFGWKMAIPPRVADGMDDAQRWAIACTREALADYGYPARPLNTERTAVILGNAMAGEKHYLTTLRAFFPEYAQELDECAGFGALPEGVRGEIVREWRARMGSKLPPITEDSMPGELSNCLAGRVANVFNFRGPNFVCDAACASAMAAVRAAVEGLIEHDFDVAVSGGVDRNMGAPTFIKFCKIGALSATGSRPYAEGADGFVMGEGASIFVLKRLEDAERDGDRIYAVIRGIGGSSDGKGKGITAPNPVGQRLAIVRGWRNAGVSPLTATMIEGHGTSTSVGDVVEVESVAAVLKEEGANGHPIALGSVKSNIGHLKGAAGAAGLLKTALALHHKTLPPERPVRPAEFEH
jgi:acyl transferase domain-containing protein